MAYALATEDLANKVVSEGLPDCQTELTMYLEWEDLLENIDSEAQKLGIQETDKVVVLSVDLNRLSWLEVLDRGTWVAIPEQEISAERFSVLNVTF